MATLLEQLQRESDDLCGHRGLIPGTDHQTYSMSLPTKLRNYYDKVVTPATSSGVTGVGGGTVGSQIMSAGSRPHSRLNGGTIQHVVQAYTTMNKFLARFLEHVRFNFFYVVVSLQLSMMGFAGP